MRLRLCTICLLPLLVIGCSTVRVAPVAAPTVVAPPSRVDKANAQEFPAGDSDGYRPPARLAVLLPMTGSLAPAATAVRDGFLASYYAEGRRRPEIKFYNSLGTGNGAQAAMNKAIGDGAQMIVGPLSKDEVNAVIGQAGSGLPMITLNQGSRLPPAGTASFALLPDDEGRAAANRLADRGLRTVLVFVERSDNAQRAAAGFSETMRMRDGTVLAEFPIAGETTDMGAQLDAMIKGATPPNAVFFALDAAKARAMTAQLRASDLAGLPIIATSLILSGANSRSDLALNGVEYPEMPWLLGQAGNLPDADSLGKRLPGARGSSQRLFAFGADAWKLTAFFQRLYDDPGFSIQGNTGRLSVEIDGTVRLVPSWAVFSGGRGVPSR